MRRPDPSRRCSRWALLLTLAFGMSQVNASCSYAPPPLPSHGQAADTLGEAHGQLGVEAGRGTVASWWKASYIGDPEVTSGWVGAGRLRLGVTRNTDVGLVGALGPEQAFFGATELKWRFAHFAPPGAEGTPGFHAAWLSGLGAGELVLRGESERRPFVVPYTGVLASGGIELVQMYVGLRFAASEVLGNAQNDVTLFPILGFGVQLRPNDWLTLYAEGSAAAGITTEDLNDTGLLIYPCLGASLGFDGLWSSTEAERRP